MKLFRVQVVKGCVIFKMWFLSEQLVGEKGIEEYAWKVFMGQVWKWYYNFCLYFIGYMVIFNCR